ncbi:PREDICTED: peroxisome proliferator-activated receptor gamma coactivator-related protein 1 isoform X3 [Calidris pugnax]|uniref:peroxisome proliferator-activated receptor gamma coactivator-related protein 1 isoform X3 n=1 Tax=Calidris pugnax TaxID=198806 RepID=UPI00071D0160|nr:PREDICTED: peroxisome proliferator-activated receptor gamma coactivator-related protein 1 isoform X3 [Calidris pugnax]
MGWGEPASSLPIQPGRCLVLGRVVALWIDLSQWGSCRVSRWCGDIPGDWKGLRLKVAEGFAQWGGLAQTPPEKQRRKVFCAVFWPAAWPCPTGLPSVFGMLGGSMCPVEETNAGSGAVQSLYLAPPAPRQCFSLEEDDLNITSLDAETILEAEEILGTMQNYLDSSVISIIEDLSLSESKACLDAQNELSLLTAITEILDSTDDETLSPFDTIMDAELLTSPRERENPSFQKFLSLSRPSLECESPALEQPKALRPLSSSISVVGKTDTDLAWDRAAHGLEDPVLPKKQVCSTPRVERKVGRHRTREQPLPQRSDGEEEEEEAALSPGRDSSMEAGELRVSRAGAALEEREDPCIINTGDVSLSELVKSMHPYCLPTFTVCLDPETEPVAKELLSGPVLLEIVPGEGESVEIPVVLQPLAPTFPELEPQLLSAEEGTGRSIPADQEELPGAPAQENRVEEKKEEKPPGKEPSCTTPESTSPPEKAAPRACSPDSSSQPSTGAPVGSKREGSEKGRGRERARKSRKKKGEEDQSEQARPGRDCVAHRLRSAGSGHPPGQPPSSRRRAACPSVQVSDFLARQLERAQKEGQMELRAERAPRPRGRPRSTTGASPLEKAQRELQKEPAPETVSVALEKAQRELQKEPAPETVSVALEKAQWEQQKEPAPETVSMALEKAETVVPLEKTAPSVEEQPAAACPSPADQAEGEGDAQPAAGQGGGVSEAASPLQEQGVGLEPPQSLPATEPSEGLPKEAKPKALSLREYRIRMLHRQPSPGDRKDGEKQAASKWPSVPEPPTELAEIPCLVPPVRPATEAAGTQKSPEKPTSPAAVSSAAGKAPPAPASAPTPATAPAPATAPPPPSTPMPFVAPNVPPAGMPPASAGAYALYPPVPSWPCFNPQPVGCHGLPPPPGASSSSTFHMVPGLPPPAMAWPPPAVPPPPPFGPGGPYTPVGWASPSYWPGIPVPPPVPPLAYGDPGAALQGAATFPAGGHPGTAILHGQPPATPALGCPEPPAFLAQPPNAPASEMGAAGGPARPATSRVSDPRRQARLAGESSLPKTPPAPAQPPAASSPAAAQPSRVPAAAPALQAAPTQPPEEPQAATPPQLPKVPPAATHCPAEVSPAEVSPAAGPAEENPGARPTEETAGPGKGSVEKALPEPKATAGQEAPSQKSTPQAVAPPPKVGRESSLPTKAPAARPWRHQPLLSPAQPSDSSKDIVQAFISEIGIEATDLSSLLEQFEKSEAKKEETPVQPPEDRRPAGSSGPETQQDRKPLDGLQASELANVAGLTPPATPPHQLWKPLPAVSLLAKAKSPGSTPQEGAQKMATVVKAKPLLPSKLQGKSPAPVTASSAPSHVCSGDHDYCIPGAARPESSPGTQPPAEGGSRWNVKHLRDITIKPISSLTKRTLDQPKSTPPAPTTSVGTGQEPLGTACLAPLDYRTSVPTKATAGCSSPPTSVLLSPAASPCRDQETRTPSAQPGRAAAKRSLRCYRRPRDSPSPSAGSWRAGRSRASRSFSSSSDGASESSSSSSSSSSRSRSRSLSPPPKRWRRYRSRCSHSSSSRSSCGSCGRSRDRSSSSSSTSSYSSRSTSRSQSRSPSPRRRSNRRRRYSYDAQDHYQRQRILQKERAIEERRVVFIGKIPSRMTRSELRHRFSVFGDIEECTLHFRSEGDNYGFVTYRYAEEAFAAIESGHKLRRPDEQPFDLCFGGRRQFCRRNYADLDSNREDFDPAPVKSKFDSLDFDTLLRQAQRSLRR